jgi:hypothetical protein
MNKLSAIETVLFEREVALLNKEIIRAQTILFEAFRKYSFEHDGKISINKERLQELREFIFKLRVVDSYYYAGTWLAAAGEEISKDPAQVPTFLRELILKKVTVDFLAKVDSVEEVRALAEDAAQIATGREG